MILPQGTSVSIDIEDDRWEALPDLHPLASSAASAALQGKTGEITLLFSSDDEIRDLNRTWRGQDKPTNVLSFPNIDDAPLVPGEALHLGDIAFAFGTIAREAQEQGKSLAAHTQHLIVHGVLHILGYDHGDDAEAETMENLERRILADLGVSDPYVND